MQQGVRGLIENLQLKVLLTIVMFEAGLESLSSTVQQPTRVRPRLSPVLHVYKQVVLMNPENILLTH